MRYQFSWKDGRVVTMQVDELGHITYAEISSPSGFLPSDLKHAPWPTWARQCHADERFMEWQATKPLRIE